MPHAAALLASSWARLVVALLPVILSCLPPPSCALPCRREGDGYKTDCVSGYCECTCAPGYDNRGGTFTVCRRCDPGLYKSWTGPFQCQSCEIPSAKCPQNAYLANCGYDTAGQCMLCSKCPPGMWMSRCSGSGNEGRECSFCDRSMCAFDEALVNCTGTEPGWCKKCAECPPHTYMSACTPDGPLCAPCDPQRCLLGQYLDGCGGIEQGECLACDRAGRCKPGQVVKDCSPGNPGFCTDCPDGFFRSNSSGGCENCNQTECAIDEFLYQCQGDFPGGCVACEKCPEDQYLTSCTRDYTTCEFCNAHGRVRFDEYLVGCGNNSAGYREKCPRCGELQYLVGCSKQGIPVCRECDASECLDSEFLIGCQGTNPGFCASCQNAGLVCPEREYPVNCGGLTSGHCESCKEDCGAGNVRLQCGVPGNNQTAGYCAPCPQGEYRYPGQAGFGCASCEETKKSFGCSELAGCGGDSPGLCVQANPVDASACGPCESGEFTMTCAKNGKKICGKCAEKPPCPAGETLVGCGPDTGAGQCEPCPAGTFKPHAGNSPCTPCAGCENASATRFGCQFASAGECRLGCGKYPSCPHNRTQYPIDCTETNELVCSPCYPPCPGDSIGGMTSCFGPGPSGRTCAPSVAGELPLDDIESFLRANGLTTGNGHRLLPWDGLGFLCLWITCLAVLLP